MGAREYLREQLEREYRTYFGLPSEAFLEGVVQAWMDDSANSKHRFDSIEKHLPGATRILDMASGCGTAVYFGLLNGYDMTGIDPAPWKHTFNAMKAEELGYPAAWQRCFHEGVGENLPFPDDHFDCVTTYQTLEHVQDVDQVLCEMIRVTRKGGGIHIRCPDYRGTFEGHYRIPWFPLLPRPLARLYLRALGRPRKGLDTLNYVTAPRVVCSLRAAQARRPAWKLCIVHVDHESFVENRTNRGGPVLPGAFLAYRTRRFLKALFRQELTVNLFVHVLAK